MPRLHSPMLQPTMLNRGAIAGLGYVENIISYQE
jgi:hypothetical protein